MSEPTYEMPNPRQPLPVPSEAARQQDFTQSFDAQDWAREFVKRARADHRFATDEGTMIGWFANALMRGFDEHARRQRDSSSSADRAALRQEIEQAIVDMEASRDLWASIVTLPHLCASQDLLIDLLRRCLAVLKEQEG